MSRYSIALINPNSSLTTSDMMGLLAAKYLPAEFDLRPITATTTPAMLVSVEDVARAQEEVISLGVEAAMTADAIVIAAFGDPALHALRHLVRIPVVGIGEAALLAASTGQRHFAVVTITPALKNDIAGYIDLLGLTANCCGVFITDASPGQLMNDADLQDQQLYQTCLSAIKQGAEAIVIGGGPLAASAERLKSRLPVPIISPLIAGIVAVVDRVRAGTAART